MKKKLHLARYLCIALPFLVLAPDLVRAESTGKHFKVNKLAGVALLKPFQTAEITIQGKVTDEKNEPLPGVTVQLKGTTTGASTNVDGSYALTLPSGNATLVFSYVGYRDRKWRLITDG